MKICAITRTTTEHHVGGMEDHIKTLYKGVSGKGIKVHIITTRHPKDKEYENADGIETFYLKKTRPGTYGYSWCKQSLKAFLKLHKENNYDLVHSQSIGAYNLFKRNIFKKLNLPTLASFHGTPYDEFITDLNIIKYKKGKVSRFKEWWLKMNYLHRYHMFKVVCAKADNVVATNNERAQTLEEVFGAPKDRLLTIFNGMNLDLFNPNVPTEDLRKKINISPDEKVILCMARLEIDKGVQFTIECMPRILKDVPNVKLIIVGDGPYRKELEKMVKERNIGNNVTFTGYLPFKDINKYLNLCDIFSNYSFRFTGYDLTMLEAMACGKVVLASAYGNNFTLIKDGQSGFLIPVWRTDLLGDKIIDILKNDILRDLIGKNARSRAISHFSAKKMIDETVKVYESLLRGKK